MKILNKLLIEQARSLEANLENCIQMESYGWATISSSPQRKARLERDRTRAHTRYMRRLKKALGLSVAFQIEATRQQFLGK